MRNWDLGEFRVRLNVPSLIQQVWVAIGQVITWIRGLPNPFRQVVPLISPIGSYPPRRSQLPPLPSPAHPQLYHHHRTQTYVIPLYLSMLWSWVDTEYVIHQVQHTLSTAYTVYCIISISTVSHSQTLSHLSADHVVLNSLHSHNYEVTNE